jgi:hypothetical protein
VNRSPLPSSNSPALEVFDSSCGVARRISVQSRPAKLKDDPQYGSTSAAASSVETPVAAAAFAG